MKHLIKEVAESRKRSRLITRANHISKKYSKMKMKTKKECPVSKKEPDLYKEMIPFKQLYMLQLAVLKAKIVMLQSQLQVCTYFITPILARWCKS